MTATLANITVDCDDVARTAGFWSAALDREIGGDPSPYFASLVPAAPGEPTWLFLKVPEPKTAKNRLHLDVTTSDLGLLVEAGGVVLRAQDDEISWTVMADPDGNEFCAFVQA